MLQLLRNDNEEIGSVACKTVVDHIRNYRTLTEENLGEFVGIFLDGIRRMNTVPELLSEDSKPVDATMVPLSIDSFKVLGEMGMVTVIMAQLHRPIAVAEATDKYLDHVEILAEIEAGPLPCNFSQRSSADKQAKLAQDGESYYHRREEVTTTEKKLSDANFEPLMVAANAITMHTDLVDLFRSIMLSVDFNELKLDSRQTKTSIELCSFPNKLRLLTCKGSFCLLAFTIDNSVHDHNIDRDSVTLLADENRWSKSEDVDLSKAEWKNDKDAKFIRNWYLHMRLQTLQVRDESG
ncbi:hypothetical protein DXG03_000375 [Asterophora parasitica]|uniref:Uncharacterized protein n=1 Tax=Asterophora parasitica TaxID=117018 RepID=A0A9P7GFI9_9AGAR|nr:hypothetical protein DXG03_000375 [Asterophora parasitica]